MSEPEEQARPVGPTHPNVSQACYNFETCDEEIRVLDGALQRVKQTAKREYCV